MEKFNFALLRALVGAEQGQSAYREMADGFDRRRQVRACRITTQDELAIAVRLLLSANDGWDPCGLVQQLCELVFGPQREGLVYVEAQHGRREKPVFGGVRVGSVAQVLGTDTGRRLTIPRLRPMPLLCE